TVTPATVVPLANTGAGVGAEAVEAATVATGRLVAEDESGCDAAGAQLAIKARQSRLIVARRGQVIRAPQW
ncbi:MAG: hypothetical protein ACPL8I_15720, partial [Chloroflexaceae bacterium]